MVHTLNPMWSHRFIFSNGYFPLLYKYNQMPLYHLSLSPHRSQRSCTLFLFKPISISMARFQRVVANSYLLLTVALLLGFSEAKEILVGGITDAWKIPSSQSDSLNNWAESARFRIGDFLVWKYDSQKDSVLQVTREAYLSCNTSNPIEEYRDGNTKVKLDRSGAYYFISGAEGHCVKGQKMIVVVLSQRHRYTGISPAPSPAEFEGPAVAPTSAATSLKGSLVVSLGVLLWGLF